MSSVEGGESLHAGIFDVICVCPMLLTLSGLRYIWMEAAIVEGVGPFASCGGMLMAFALMVDIVQAG